MNTRISQGRLCRGALRGGLAPLALICALAFAAPAMAGPEDPGLDSASTAVYQEAGVGGQVAGGGDGGGAGRGDVLAADQGQVAGAAAGVTGGDAEGRASSLPFTGLSAALVLGAALVLLLSGAALRVATRRPAA